MVQLLVAILVGLLVGGGAVVGVLYRQALGDVDALLAAGQPWAQSGRVWSAPMELWPGLSLTPAELAVDLQAAGYDRVAAVSLDNQFSQGADRVEVRAAAAQGPGWKLEPVSVVVAFADGRISSLGRARRVTLGPVELAGVRGPDAEARRPIALDQVPDHLAHAVLAMEDARFYEHEGVDPIGIARAILVNAVQGERAQGGSTLTQQVVKNLFLSQERTWERKAREALLALAMEARLEKREILELYLNEIYLGQVGSQAVCGVDQAARAYFGHGAREVTLGEAATLAGIVSAPNPNSPLRHPERALARRDLTLQRMVSAGFISQAEADEALSRPLEVHPTSGARRAPWLVDSAVEHIEAALGAGAVLSRGIEVHTSLQPALQRLAERAVAAGGTELDVTWPASAGAEMALVSVRVRDGAVVALVGGRSYQDSQFDRAQAGRRQVGSTVKPLTALLALEADPALGPATVFDDSSIERTINGKRWAPQNYDQTFRGPISLREAIRDSRNVPAVLLAERLGLLRLQKGLIALGLPEATAWPSAALGAFAASPIELAGAYTVFPGGGRLVQPWIVGGAVDATGQAVWADPRGATDLASRRAAFLATDLLVEVVARGTGKAAARYGLSGLVGGKTGTTDDTRDAWFVGFTGELVTAVWVGFDRGRDLGLTGGKAALPTWSRFMASTGALGATAPGFQRPVDVVGAKVCAASGQRPVAACPLVSDEWFSRGHEPSEPCAAHQGPGGQAIDDLRRAFGRLLGSGGATTADDAAAEPDAEEAPRGRLFRRRP